MHQKWELRFLKNFHDFHVKFKLFITNKNYLHKIVKITYHLPIRIKK